MHVNNYVTKILRKHSEIKISLGNLVIGNINLLLTSNIVVLKRAVIVNLKTTLYGTLYDFSIIMSNQEKVFFPFLI